MTDDAHIRDNDRCPFCDTPLEVSEVTARDDDGPRELILRCANGHSIEVRREELFHDESADG